MTAVLRVLLEGLGLAAEPVQEPGIADFAYATARPRGLAPDAVWMRAVPAADWDVPAVHLVWLDAIPVWSARAESAGSQHRAAAV